MYQEQEERMAELENRISERDFEHFTGGERFLLKMQGLMGRTVDPVLDSGVRVGQPKTERKKAKRGR
jgi:predicted mannosyl-3-phosphoglycerate phosphatase (HAD superfamily)